MRRRGSDYARGAALSLAIALSFVLPAFAQPTDDYVKQGVKAFKHGDESSMLEAKKMYEQALKLDPKNYDAAWHLAETSYYLWEAASGWESGMGGKQRFLLDISRYGVQAGALAVKIKPDGVEGLFWYSAALGIWGLTNGPLDSLTQVSTILKQTQRCIELDPNGVFERGGCYRVAAGVYSQLPGFPISIGDKRKAEDLFQKSFIKGRGYGINHNMRAELFMTTKDHKTAKQILEANLKMMRARKPYDYFDLRDIKRAEELLAEVGE